MQFTALLRPLRAATPRRIVEGGAFGALAGLLFWQLGILEVVAFRDPYDTTIIGFFIGAAAAIVSWHAVILWADVAMLAALLLITNTPLAAIPAMRWVRDDGPVTTPVDAVVVLSSNVNSDSSIDMEATQRLLTGLALMKAGAAPRLVTSRVTVGYNGVDVSSDSGQARLIDLAGVRAAWSVVDSVHSTRDEATQIAKLLTFPTTHTIVLVTSPMHTRRACATFEGVGFRVHCIASHEMESNSRRPINSMDRLVAFRNYLYERLGVVKYRAEGWIR